MLSTEYAPSGPLRVWNEYPVIAFESCTTAAGAGAPEASRTFPRSVPAPPSDCAAACAIQQTAHSHALTLIVT